MGNRAIVIVAPEGRTYEQSVGVYLHWNGGPESVQAFVEFTSRYVRNGDYFTARLIQVIGMYFGGTLSLGVFSDTYGNMLKRHLEDNGAYLVSAQEMKVMMHNRNEFDPEAAKNHAYWTGSPSIMDDLEKLAPIFEEAKKYEITAIPFGR